MSEPIQDTFAPAGVDLDRPSIARIYDYYLGGVANWAIDREFADRAMQAFPLIQPIAKANRLFLFRAVRHLMGLGVRQFVDLGAGVPTMGHTHSVADAYERGTARVVYVDNEPVAVAHAQILLEEEGDRRHTAINADIRAPRRLWDQVLETGLIDPDKPVALLMIAVLHVQQRDERGTDIGADIVACYRDLLPSGSYLAISHVTDEGVPAAIGAKLAEVKQMYDASTSPVIWRSHREIADLFGDFELLDPGLTWTPNWHPEETGSQHADLTFDDPSKSVIYAAVGRKP
ncbi:MAG TPA: SAM-dependent methyltransferase [Pseudonocardiaceae bacterium]|nr:SAM-dependent methyltransferase [Pseudonocardiaceae bacterium]